MKWTKKAEEAISKVPFFVRRRVRKRVEDEAANAGANIVDDRHVQACRRRFLKNMDAEVEGFQLDACFGSGGCPNRAQQTEELMRKIERLLVSSDLRVFLKERVCGPLKLHHELRVSVSDCPNACSRPQIVDIGIIGAIMPSVSGTACSLCGSCVEACRERAIALDADQGLPLLDYHRCVYCGQCVLACPTDTLIKGAEGFRVLIGGKLGRHPRLAKELPGIHSPRRTIEIVEACIDYYKAHNLAGERFGAMIERDGWEPLSYQ